MTTRRRRRPLLAALILLAFYGGGAGFIIVAFNLQGQNHRSDVTQSRGIRAQATVENVSDHEDCHSNSCTYTSKLGVLLAHPIRGVTHTTVHYDDSSQLQPGQHTPVLVDPEDLAYAELPTAGFAGSSEWITAAVVGALLIAWPTFLACLIARAVWRRRRA